MSYFLIQRLLLICFICQDNIKNEIMCMTSKAEFSCLCPAEFCTAIKPGWDAISRQRLTSGCSSWSLSLLGLHSRVPLNALQNLNREQKESYSWQIGYFRGIREMITRLAFKLLLEFTSMAHSDRWLNERDWSPGVESINQLYKTSINISGLPELAKSFICFIVVGNQHPKQQKAEYSHLLSLINTLIFNMTPYSFHHLELHITA